MNNLAVPAVNELSEQEFAELMAIAHLVETVVDDSDPDIALGFVVIFTAGSDYASENYRWFEARGGDFLYVDRIVVGQGSRGRGLGQVLYDRVFTEARLAGLADVTCEVNLDPPNPGSLAFHDRLGFAQVGELVTKGGSVTVALLSASVG